MSKRSRATGQHWPAELATITKLAPESLRDRAERRAVEMCEALGLSFADLRSASREQFFVFSRYIVVAQLTADGFPYTISAETVGRERTMVRHGLDTFDDLIESRHPQFLEMLERWQRRRDHVGVDSGGITPRA